MSDDQNQPGNRDEGPRGHWTHRPWNHDRERLQRKLDELQRLQFGRRGFLRPQILELFEQGPMNGVDIMNRLQQESRGWYRPSPGSIYPLLEQLEKEGLIVKNKDGKFELTSAYAELSGVSKDVAGALSSLESNVSYLEDLQGADSARLSKSAERIEKLAKRLQDLKGSLQSARSQ